MTSAPDMTASIEPRSDQLNAEDLITGPRTITITAVKRGSAEQPVDIVTEEYGPGRPYKPSKTMRRIIVAAWGKDSAAYVGRRLTIYRDPDITFGRDKVGGIRISHMSDIPKRLEIALTVTRGRRSTFAVEPLPAESAPAVQAAPAVQEVITAEDATDFARDIAEATTIPELEALAKELKARDLGEHKARLLTAWTERKAALSGEA